MEEKDGGSEIPPILFVTRGIPFVNMMEMPFRKSLSAIIRRS